MEWVLFKWDDPTTHPEHEEEIVFTVKHKDRSTSISTQLGYMMAIESRTWLVGDSTAYSRRDIDYEFYWCKLTDPFSKEST